MLLPPIKAFIFDLDGVFYRGEEALKGGFEMLEYLKQKGFPFAFFTNNSRKNPHAYVKHLAKKGLHVNKNQILTSGLVSYRLVQERFASKKVYVFGSPALKELFCELTCKDDDPEIVVVGMDGDMTLDEISTMRDFACSGVQFIFTNPDILIPADNGYKFECGVMIGILKEYCKVPPIVAGKPSSFGYGYLANMLGVTCKKIAMVGDTYETDIQGAIDFGLIPIHLQTSDSFYNKNILKAYEFKNLFDLLENIKER